MNRPHSPTSQSASSRAYKFIRNRIVFGEYAPETMISESEVAGDLGVSRTPVREAFQQLARENWLRIYPKRGAMIVRPKNSEVKDIFEVREALQTWIVQKIIEEPIPSHLVQQLTAANEQSRKNIDADPMTFRDTAVRIHEILFAASGNDLFVEILDMLQQRGLRVGATSVRPDPSPEERHAMIARHEALVEAIVDRDPERAREVLADHFRQSVALTRRPLP